MAWPARVPADMSGHQWSGLGRPITALVEPLVASLRTSGLFPSAPLLRSWPDLEALAARAIALAAPTRLVAILHADDPVLLSSSEGVLTAILCSVTASCSEHNARFHLGKSKTVAMC